MMTRRWTSLLVALSVGSLPVPALAQERQVEVKLVKTVETKARAGGAFSPDGKVYVERIIDDELQVYDTTTGKPTATKAAARSSDGYARPLFSPDGTLLAFIVRHSFTDKEAASFVSLWETKTWTQTAVLRMEHASKIVFSPDSRTLVVDNMAPNTGPRSHLLSFVDVKGEKGVRERALFTRKGDSRDLVYSPDGKLFFMNSQFLKTATEEWLKFPSGRRFPDGGSYAKEVVFSQDSASFSGLVQESGKPPVRKYWDLKTGKEIEPKGFRGAPGATETITYSPDWKTSVREGTTSVREKGQGEKEFVQGLLLTDFNSGNTLAVIEHARFPLVFSADGKMLTGFSKGGFTTWELNWKDKPAK